ncbi:MAG: BolA/IbaG family iron-sulfur metabolism protein [Candidatus Omnitrophota bacterium]
MIAAQEVEQMILAVLPDAKVEIRDMTGGGDHFEIFVVSKAFAGVTLLEQHKMVFAALEKEMDRRIHAVQLKTRTP